MGWPPFSFWAGLSLLSRFQVWRFQLQPRATGSFHLFLSASTRKKLYPLLGRVCGLFSDDDFLRA